MVTGDDWRLAVLETFCLVSPELDPIFNFKSMNDKIPDIVSGNSS